MRALVREVSGRIASCELSYVARQPIDVAQARAQHAKYCAALQELGCDVSWLPPLEEQPDGVFVEDTAVLVPEVAVVTRPGADTRRAEVASIAAALAEHLEVRHIEAPATLEGGDVLRIGRKLYVGASQRSNADGVAQLAAALGPFGYQVKAVKLEGCLHLKSACTFIPPDLLLVNPAWVDVRAFGTARVVVVGAGEDYGANTLSLGGTTLVSSDYPRTRERLETARVRTRALTVSELHKAEAALTCLSLILEESA